MAELPGPGSAAYNRGMPPDEIVLATEAQLLLAEKRTALSVLRTALAMLALPLSVASVLIATSRYYEVSNVLVLLLPVLAISGALTLLACYLIVRSLRRLHYLDTKLDGIKQLSSQIAQFVVE